MRYRVDLAITVDVEADNEEHAEEVARSVTFSDAEVEQVTLLDNPKQRKLFED